MDFSSFILEQFRSLAMTVSVWQSDDDGDDESVNLSWERIRDRLGAKILALMLISLTIRQYLGPALNIFRINKWKTFYGIYMI